MEKARSDPASIHARIAAWYKLGKGTSLAIRGDKVHRYLRTPVRPPPTTHRPKCSFGALRRSRRLSCTSRRLCCERADICLYPICTKPRCVGVCLRGRTALSPCDPVRQPRRCCFLPKGGIVWGATRPPVFDISRRLCCTHACSE